MQRLGLNNQVQLDRTSVVFRPSNWDVRRAISLGFVGLIGLYLLIFFILITRDNSVFLKDADVYWHIAAGRMIWQTKALPHVDHLSHTFSGHAWIAKEWLSQLFLYGVYTLAG